MTATEWETIERVAKLFKFTVHEATPDSNGELGRVITDKPDKLRSEFWWRETEGFDQFFIQLYQYGYDKGRDSIAYGGW